MSNLAIGRKVELFNTYDNVYTLSVNGVLLHSVYHPLKEAVNFAKYREKKVKDKRNIVIYGIGLGYHILELLKVIDEKSNVNVFDVDEEVMKAALQYGVLKEILKDKRVSVSCTYNGDTLKKLSKCIDESDAFIIYKPSARVLPEGCNEFKEALQRFEIAVIEFERHGEIAKKNSLLNEKMKFDTIEKFFKEYNFRNKKIIIAAAGPSLGLNIGKIKKIRDKAIIFAVGSSLKTLMNAGIKPDMITIIDPQEIVYNQIEGYENLDVPMCFLNIASNLAVTKYNGPKFMFYNSGDGVVNEDKVIDTGKSVATAALSIAIKEDANSVIFVGQDLAYLNNKSHCDDYIHGNAPVFNSDLTKKVEGVDGSILKTTSGWLYMKKWLEDKIAKYTHIKFINCSAGARIKGTINADIEKIF
ncbi:DUF115 domain-containing protein [Clostridium sp. CT7]|nr:DUF115 domain-containing protein [Clostridium sp. CT7]